MSNPIRIVSMGGTPPAPYVITGIADHDVEVIVTCRVDNAPAATHCYHASIDGLPGYEARGATERGAAEALCGRLIADLTKSPDPDDVRSGPEMLLLHLADSERNRHEAKGYKYGSPDSIDSIARQEAYRAAAQIIRAARVLAEPTEAQKRLWSNMAQANAIHDGTAEVESGR